MSKGTFSEQAQEILGDGIEEAIITLRRSVDEGVTVSVAYATENHGVIRQYQELPIEKLNQHRLLRGALITSMAIIAAATLDLDDA